MTSDGMEVSHRVRKRSVVVVWFGGAGRREAGREAERQGGREGKGQGEDKMKETLEAKE